MKEITLKTMLIWYSIALFVFGALGIEIAAIVSGAGMLSIIVLALTPLLSSVIGLKIAIGKKRLRDTDNSNVKVLLANIIALGLAYGFLLKFDVLLVSIFAFGGVFAYIYSSKKIKEKLAENVAVEKTVEVNNTVVENNYTNNIEEPARENKDMVKKYTLSSFSDASIREFLVMNGLNPDNYVFGSIMPKTSSMVLFGSLATVGITNYIIAFDNASIYMFELSRLSNKSIEDCMIIAVQTIKEVKINSILFGAARRAIITFDDKQRIELQMNKKVMGLKSQNEDIDRFIDICQKK